MEGNNQATPFFESEISTMPIPEYNATARGANQEV
jgi:hypothetical protein